MIRGAVLPERLRGGCGIWFAEQELTEGDGRVGNLLEN
jgi:hypothetical protein